MSSERERGLSERSNRMSAPAEGFCSADRYPLRRRGEGTPEPPPAPLQQQPKLSPRTPDRVSPYQRTGPCFTYKQEGHWSRDCPTKNSADRKWQSPDLAFVDGGAAVGAPQCTCGAGPCVVKISRTEKNPGRKFFTCAAKSINDKCDFFQWCDSPSPRKQHVASPVQHHINLGNPVQQQVGNTQQQADWPPVCQCGAGWCIVLTKEEGEDAGREYFSCPKKKCDFSRWCDELNVSGKCIARPHHQDLVSPPCGIAKTQYPNCTCGAGRCRLLTMDVGEFAGRNYFGCPVKKGQGACNFFQWQNAAEGDNEHGKHHVPGRMNQHPNLVTEEPGVVKSYNVEPTLLNFDNIDMGESNAHSVKGQPLSPLEQQQGDAEGLSAQNRRPGLHSSSPSVSFKPGKCFRCGKEGHWMTDCVELLPSPLSPLEQQQGDAEGLSAQSSRPGFNSSSPSVSFKPGKCFRCGKEGHWKADCGISDFSSLVRDLWSKHRSRIFLVE